MSTGEKICFAFKEKHQKTHRLEISELQKNIEILKQTVSDQERKLNVKEEKMSLVEKIVCSKCPMKEFKTEIGLLRHIVDKHVEQS